MTKPIAPVIRRTPQRLARESWAAGRAAWGVDAPNRDHKVTNCVVDTVYADEELAEDLGVPPGYKLARRFRVFWVDGYPVQHAHSYLPFRLVEGSRIMQEDTGPGGTPQVLSELGRPPRFACEEVIHGEANIEDAHWLGITPGDPVYRIRRIMDDPDGIPVEVTSMVLDARVYRLQYCFEL
jgi:GntR family transcriptional regulator